MNFFVDFKKNENGEHEIHHEGCSKVNSFNHLTYLGDFNELKKAISKANEIYSLVRPCPYCGQSHQKD